jgi:hypothetical protein
MASFSHFVSILLAAGDHRRTTKLTLFVCMTECMTTIFSNPRQSIPYNNTSLKVFQKYTCYKRRPVYIIDQRTCTRACVRV